MNRSFLFDYLIKQLIIVLAILVENGLHLEFVLLGMQQESSHQVFHSHISICQIYDDWMRTLNGTFVRK